MHPNIKSHEPGSCPVCGMDLVLLETEQPSEGSDSGEEEIFIPDAPVLAGIESEVVQKEVATVSVRAVGSMSFDEEGIHHSGLCGWKN